MDEKIKEIEKLDLIQFGLVFCFNLEAAAEIFFCAGKIDPSNKRPRVEHIVGISTDFSNPADKIKDIEFAYTIARKPLTMSSGAGFLRAIRTI